MWWTVPAPGQYAVTVSVKHQGELGEDTEDATFSLIAVEYPAPPATFQSRALLPEHTPSTRAEVLLER